MKQTILQMLLGALLVALTTCLHAQSAPQFSAGAYTVVDGASHTHFIWAAQTPEFDTAVETWHNCGPNVSVVNTYTDGKYHIELIIREQTGPEYVAKLMSVVGITQYLWNDQTKDISALEADLQIK